MSIGQRIRDLRVQNGMSQGDIERETGMLRGYISRVERGHTVPSVETLHRFASALDVPMYRLFTGEEPGPLAAIGGRPPSTLEELAHAGGSEGSEARFLVRIKNLAGSITESDRAFLLNFARRLASLRHQSDFSADYIKMTSVEPPFQATFSPGRKNKKPAGQTIQAAPHLLPRS
jgi:transcriptional regulator with XRE-family HTH domain